jgi:hypothetical protein
LARAAQPPPKAAKVATAAKVAAMPISMGKPRRKKDLSELAKTKGSTGRMHGLAMVSAPPRKARRYRTIR